MKIQFKKLAVSQLKKLDANTRKRILQKLQWLSYQEAPLLFAKPLKDSEIGRYRFRIGDYRVIFDLKNNIIFVLSLGHRRDIYR